ncbi:unnamed protein product [Boreogadus saida]
MRFLELEEKEIWKPKLLAWMLAAAQKNPVSSALAICSADGRLSEVTLLLLSTEAVLRRHELCGANGKQGPPASPTHGGNAQGRLWL